MSKNLVIVESPAKAKTIEKFLGKDFVVKSSMGHVRDLPKKDLGIDIAQDFLPLYEIMPDKKKIVNELKSDVKATDMVWLATDEDREGEAISWHLMETLNIPNNKVKRIAFHEITKQAIEQAITHPRALDINLVNAQQARRVLDRLVGFELSPILWHKIKPSLSAGRVQSVAVRLIVEKEKDIRNFQSTSSYRVTALFLTDEKNKKGFSAELNTRFSTKEEALNFLESCKTASYNVSNIDKKPTKKSPAAPFTTSTLQQEASRKLGFSVSKTMLVAQQLYEAGFITYMRTDAVTLSDLALADAKKEIESLYGSKYAKTRKYVTKSKGAQEAHEAIRPTNMSVHTITSGDASQKKLYDLIWKRTIASQMSDAQFEKTDIEIKTSNSEYLFSASGEILLFDGFYKVYLESHDDEEENENKNTILPIVNIGTPLYTEKIEATEKYTQQPYRYTEASLVKKLEELGIGRPSTYAPIISTIQKRGYVTNTEKEGFERKYQIITLQKNKISQSSKTEKIGYEKGKLSPTDIGVIVNDFLVQNFNNIMDYDFTAKVEKKFDDIALGKIKWTNMIKSFYAPFHQEVTFTMEHSEKARGERFLGIDPKSGKKVFVKLGKYGPIVQIGESNSEDELKFASLLPGQSIESITFEQALDLFKLPRTIGVVENEELVANIGRFGPYVRYKGKFYSIPKTENILTIDVDKCMEIIAKKDEKNAQKQLISLGNYNNEDVSVAVGRFGPYVFFNKHFYPLPSDTDIKKVSLEEAVKAIEEVENKKNIKTFDNDASVKILNGRYGPYIAQNNMNYKIPKDIDPKNLSYQDCLDIIAKESNKKKTPKKTSRKSK